MARVREFMIHVVLHTDMSGHFEMETQVCFGGGGGVVLFLFFLSHFLFFFQVKTFLKNKGVESFGESKDSKKLLGSALLHAADISNPSKSFSVARYWSCNINEEFFCQGAKEKVFFFIFFFLPPHFLSFPFLSFPFLSFPSLPFFFLADSSPPYQELALPISPMCDKTQADTVPAGQIG